jgi:hypothetical protein
MLFRPKSLPFRVLIEGNKPRGEGNPERKRHDGKNLRTDIA